MAAQEGFGGAAQEANGARSTGGGSASAGGAFVALLALLQNRGAVGEVAATPGAPDGSDVVDGEPPDAGDEPAGESAEGGVVVSLSVAANAVAAGAVTVDVAQAAGAAAQEGTKAALAFSSPQGGKSAAATKAFAAIAGVIGDPAPGATATANANVAAGAGQGITDAAVAAASEGDGASSPEKASPAAKPVKSDIAALARGAQGAIANGDPAKAAAGSARLAAHAAGVPARNGDDGAKQPATGGPGTTPATQANAPAAAADGGAAEQGTGPEAAHAVARRATGATHPEPRIANADVDDAGDAAETKDAFGSSNGATGSGATRELPSGVRVLSEALPLQDGQAHGAQHATDASLRADALGAARSDATGASSSANGATRLRASGLASGEAGLPSWVERLASPEGLAATRRGNTLHLDLEPNGLGRIELRLSFGRDGVRASVLTEHEHTRTLLASQQPQLAAALERNDVRLESFLVDVGAQSGGDGREAWRDATDPAAFDQIGLVHPSASEPVLDEPATPARGLVNVRA